MIDLPVTHVAAHWHAALAWGDWVPLLIGYGGVIAAALLALIALAIS